ncbi:polysaccharide deacetylase family protein [Sphingomonas radiodurans]|uniref:polysaccharide deacetylase family protein n=1 Tax=Sphingomonas radiodurans TaxID=2890321 RepID=UPI001E31F51E|nr:polysaccharide deacetylase family protein [Sphingomonas radiodurans]WBH17818.1 polysaccharide deacetylase family protein [Sphingomonas radiodurans]
MTRKEERRRRVLRWSAMLGAGIVSAAAIVLLIPGALGLIAAALAVLLALVAGHRVMIAPPGVAILTYHSISPQPGWLPWSRDIAVHPDTFARHLATLDRIGAKVIATREFVERRRAGEPVPDRSVVLHFDDGYLDNHQYAMPLLQRHAMPATFFPSLDFIEPDDRPRHDGSGEGYMRWAELIDLRAFGFEVEPHGVDHARVPTSDKIVGRLDAANWRQHAWMQWAATPGPKHDWFRMAAPAAVPLGSPIPASGLALAERAWIGSAREDTTAFVGRIERDLVACRTTFSQRLGSPPRIFCWPENKVGNEGREIARRLGYVASTGGKRRNTAEEPAEVLSRLHIDDRALGFRWLPAEALYLRASVRLMQGNHYWYLLLAPMQAFRRFMIALRSRLGDDFC